MIISIDCGVKNSAICITDKYGILIHAELFQLSASKDLIQICIDSKISLNQLSERLSRFEIDNNNLTVIIEQQPHINRKSCLVHDLFVAHFYQAQQIIDIHPSKRYQLVSKSNNKKNVVEYVIQYLRDQDSVNSQMILEIINLSKKKDDICDVILQLIQYQREQQ